MDPRIIPPPAPSGNPSRYQVRPLTGSLFDAVLDTPAFRLTAADGSIDRLDTTTQLYLHPDQMELHTRFGVYAVTRPASRNTILVILDCTRQVLDHGNLTSGTITLDQREYVGIPKDAWDRVEAYRMGPPKEPMPPMPPAPDMAVVG